MPGTVRDRGHAPEAGDVHASQRPALGGVSALGHDDAVCVASCPVVSALDAVPLPLLPVSMRTHVLAHPCERAVLASVVASPALLDPVQVRTLSRGLSASQFGAVVLARRDAGLLDGPMPGMTPRLVMVLRHLSSWADLPHGPGCPCGFAGVVAGVALQRLVAARSRPSGELLAQLAASCAEWSGHAAGQVGWTGRTVGALCGFLPQALAAGCRVPARTWSALLACRPGARMVHRLLRSLVRRRSAGLVPAWVLVSLTGTLPVADAVRWRSLVLGEVPVGDLLARCSAQRVAQVVARQGVSVRADGPAVRAVRYRRRLPTTGGRNLPEQVDQDVALLAGCAVGQLVDHGPLGALGAVRVLDARCGQRVNEDVLLAAALTWQKDSPVLVGEWAAGAAAFA